MPTVLNVGLSKKIGLPDYGSLGASCNVQVELDATLLQGDLETFHRHVRNAYVACRQAVQDELTRHAQPTNGHGTSASNGHSAVNGNGHGRSTVRRRDNTRRATASQVRAIGAIADRQRLDVGKLLRERFDIEEAAELSITEASQLIDELKTVLNGNGGKS